MLQQIFGGSVRRILGQALNRVFFAFDATKVTFTAGMAKRKPPTGPFAAAPIVQGKWADASGSDVITFSRGTQISGAFYTNWDNYQGTIELWLTPEWAGNDNLNHYICQWSTNGYLAKNSSNNLILSVASGKTVSVVCAYVAGTTYHIVARWDSKSTLDGTNYCCISSNDAHTFGVTSTWTVETPSATIYLGSDASGVNSIAGILQGFVVYRRVAWDGVQGIDTGLGDEINLAYGP